MDETNIRDWLYDPIGVLRVISQEDTEGNWVRVAEYLDIPGCIAAAETAEEAVAAVEELKQQHISRLQVAGSDDSSQVSTRRVSVPVAWIGGSWD